MKTGIFCVVHNSSFDASLALMGLLKAQDPEWEFVVIGYFQDPQYEAGLSKLIEAHRHTFKEYIRFEQSPSMMTHVMKLLALKKRLKALNKKVEPEFMVTYTEGGGLDWFCLGVARELRIPALCLQHSLFYNPDIYDRISSAKRPQGASHALSLLIKKLLKLDYPRMWYFGDGAADRICTMGEYWTDQLKQSFPQLKDKFVTIGNPRFLKYGPVIADSKTRDMVFITGAETYLFGYDPKLHLSEIKTVYEGHAAYVSKTGEASVLYHRLHPRDNCQAEVKALATKFPLVQMTSLPLEVLFGQCKGIITTRSTSGLEALLCQVPVIMIDQGDQVIAFHYERQKLAPCVHDSASLCEVLSSPLFLPERSWIRYHVDIDDVLERFLQVVYQVRKGNS